MRRSALVIVGALLLAAVVVLAGRWERGRFIDVQNSHLRALYTAVGSIDARTITAWRPGPPDCFWYRAGGAPYGISLCFDDAGRLVSGADRRGGSPVYWDLGRLGTHAAVQVPTASVATLNRKLHRLQVQLASTR